MINCRKYTRYLHKSEIQELEWYEKILSNYHIMICKSCKIYTKENSLINEYIKHQLEKHLNIDEQDIIMQKQELLKKLKL